MANIIKNKDNDKEYVFTCPICGTIFTERERNIGKNTTADGFLIGYVVDCPNCGRDSGYSELEEYDENKDYE